MPDIDEVRARYGPAAVVSQKGSFVLVHLDSPHADVIRKRTEEFDPDIVFDESCPLCRLQRSRGVFVFDDFPEDEDEWILLE